MNNPKKLFCTFALLHFCAFNTAFADDVTKNLISVTGKAEIQVVPDEIDVSMTIVKNDKSIAEAQRQNDEIATKILKVIKNKLHIDDKDVQTNSISIRPVYEYSQCGNRSCDTPQFSHFETKKGIAVKLKDADNLQKLLSEALNAGITQINSVNFTSSKLDLLQDKAQIMATVDAKRRAENIAASIGSSIGKPYRITVNQSYSPSPVPMMAMRSMAIASDSTENTIALGQITVTSNVSADFEIK